MCKRCVCFFDLQHSVGEGVRIQPTALHVSNAEADLLERCGISHYRKSAIFVIKHSSLEPNARVVFTAY